MKATSSMTVDDYTAARNNSNTHIATPTDRINTILVQARKAVWMKYTEQTAKTPHPGVNRMYLIDAWALRRNSNGPTRFADGHDARPSETRDGHVEWRGERQHVAVPPPTIGIDRSVAK
ncbi:hypothetical protein FS749_007776 [Ceratobasidium sp. UAMH 11750]|nr:hypothetical protein FS749_007776 [Ceratobasidium sp. UAMH 11750]